MTSTLDDLFDQIIHSERRAQERKSYLNEVKTQISQAEEKISDVQQEHEALKGELVIKIQQLNEEELSCKWVRNKESILFDQLSQLKLTKENLLTELSGLQESFELEMSKFCKQVNKFTTDYGLSGNGQDMREQEAKRLKESLSKEEENLSEVLNKIESCQNAVHQLQKESEKYKEILCNLQQNYKDKQEELETEKSRTRELEIQKERIMTIPQADPEFVRLHKELEDNKPEYLEEKCYELQKEVQSLQQKLWQKQVKQRQQHFQQQQSSLWQQQQQRSSLQQQQKRDVEDHPKSNRVCITNYSIASTQKENNNGSQDLTEEEKLSQEEFDEIFNEDMMTSEIKTHKNIFKPRSQSKK